MNTKLFDSELKIVEILWREGDITAKQIAEFTKREIGWSKTTTYTVIKKCIEKGIIAKREPGYICHALVSKAEVQCFETNELIERIFDGKADLLVAHLLGKGRLSKSSLEHLKNLVEHLGVDVQRLK
ncbi:MAG: BlaI/MecI/CopY family transcriptional regulator [Lachnospiraceae bacterium]|nr:BlaI/MecI/CopY family transcriptional regulator [Lachnospiraceae bacterium]MDY3223795.1 BlaI/MecI/CopY family transcriptional regulator [Lachnospiraceae bacterium]